MKSALKLRAFENVKGQIGFCGIWCGGCVVGNGTLRELTDRYQGLTRAYGLQEWAPKDFDYEEFSKGLTSLQRMPLCPGCLHDGGRKNCEMRACASDNNLDDCSQCPDPAMCEHGETLQKMHSGALGAGLRVKDEDIDRQQLIDEWTSELRSQWPCCILFMK